MAVHCRSATQLSLPQMSSSLRKAAEYLAADMLTMSAKTSIKKKIHLMKTITGYLVLLNK